MRTSFEFSSGSLALDLVDTVSARHSAPLDLIETADAAARWLAGAGFTPMRISEEDAQTLRQLRDAVFQVTDAVLHHTDPPTSGVEFLNQMARHAGFRPQWTGTLIEYRSDDPLRAALSDIAADALSNLDPAVLPRLRECEECRMLFRDRSKPGTRRWCSSSSGCGNRAKVRRHRAKMKRSN